MGLYVADDPGNGQDCQRIKGACRALGQRSIPVLTSEQIRFVHADVAEAAWRLYDSMQKATRPLAGYPVGT